MGKSKEKRSFLTSESNKLMEWFPDYFNSDEYKAAYENAVAMGNTKGRMTIFPWYYYHVKKMNETATDIAKNLKISYRTVQDELHMLGISRSASEAQRLANEHGHRDYGEIIRKGRITRLKALEDTGLFGTNAENTCRSMIGELLPEYISHEQYEYIVGINYSCAIGIYEIDIPVIVINKLTGKVYKFAVEYNGAYFHDGDIDHERDQKKFRAFTDAGWKLITVRGDAKSTNSPHEFERRAREVCAEIADSIVYRQNKLNFV